MPILPDVLDYNLRVVFCGSAASRVSAREGAYYAGPGNRFWHTLHAIGLTPYCLKPQAFPEVLRFSLGLTDLAKEAFGADRSLPAKSDDPEAVRAKVAHYSPDWLAFTGKRAAQGLLCRAVGYGIQAETFGTTRLFVLPSPSGAARRYWNESWWHDLAGLA